MRERDSGWHPWLHWVWQCHSATIVLVGVLLSMLATTGVMLSAWPTIPTGDAPLLAWWVFMSVMSLEADVFGGLVLIWVSKWLHERESPQTGDD